MPKTIKAIEAERDGYRKLYNDLVEVNNKANSEMRFLKDQLSLTNRRFDTLLDGMCMAMKEGNFPRRSV